MPIELNINFGLLKIELDHKITVQSPESKPLYHGVITFETATYKVKGENMSASMVVGSFATLSVMWFDDQENVAQGFGTTWTSSDSSSISVTQATGNPLIATVQAIKAATVTITANAFADEAQSIPVSATIDITATTVAPPAGVATHGVISFTQYPSQVPPAGKKK